MKYIVETGDLRQVIETPLTIENNCPQLLGLALSKSQYKGGLGVLFSVTPVTPEMDVEAIDTDEVDETVYMDTEYALRELGVWSDTQPLSPRQGMTGHNGS